MSEGVCAVVVSPVQEVDTLEDSRRNVFDQIILEVFPAFILVVDNCASSDNLGHQSVLSFGGSGSSLIKFMRFQFRGASAS